MKEQIIEKDGKKYKVIEMIEPSKTVVIDGFEYTTEDEQKGVSFQNVVIPEGWELWTYEDCIKLHNNEKYRKKLNLDDCWFFIQQPFSSSKKKNLVARFGADSGRAYLYCLGDPRSWDSALGVRFRRIVKKSRGAK